MISDFISFYRAAYIVCNAVSRYRTPFSSHFGLNSTVMSHFDLTSLTFDLIRGNYF